MLINQEEIEMNLNKVKLKVKALSLAAESRIIKKLEHGCEDDWGTNPIYLHRINEVRRESRATHLARAFLSGKTYSSAESSRRPSRELEFYKVKKRLTSIVSKYGYSSDDVNATIDEWLKY